MKIPGAFWVGLVVALTALLQQYINEPWVPFAIVALGAVGKLLEMWFQRQETTRAMAADAGPSRVYRPWFRWLFGG